ncbi:NAD(P)/FAD-dependent oxidoreductase [Rhodopirellula baltica]|uniref:Protein containing FAD dependent oxidoreductase domain protein n=1 Tax=Rhodopirellula baltica SWK14 TaxID=993516 RepID=L7CCT2_RHOBT|nr:NAD(P)/FAD-dependent oxidoreductase [Rhodopirellula baltica]ELP31989.1 protein containing FAD dependent oxidoreductase domain protein [Rhodopirellula baltica SWK14]
MSVASPSNPVSDSSSTPHFSSTDDGSPSTRWLVIGGGVMGLQVARDLIDRGQKVTIAEAAPTFGGLTSAWNLGDVIWDRFYHVTLLSDTKLRDLLTDLGLESQMDWVETKTGFYSGGQLISMSNTAEFLKFPPLNLIQKLRLGGTIFYASKIKNWRRLEKLSVEKWLRRWSGKGVFEKIWQPLLQAKLGEAYKQTSAAFIWAHTARMYKARRSGMKTEMFGYVPGGYATILDKWVGWLKERGAETLTSSPARQVRKLESGEFEVDFGDGRTQKFDNVVSTIASPVIANTVPQLSDEEKKRHRGIRYLGVVCASMLMKKPISEYYVTNITDTWVPLTAVIEMSTIVNPDKQLGGKYLVYLPKYLPDDHEGLNESDEDYKEKCLSTLEKMYDHFSRDQVLDFKIARAKYVAALATIDYSTRLPDIVTSVPGFYALNSAHIIKGNLNVNETITLGEEKFTEEVWPDYQRRVAK